MFNSLYSFKELYVFSKDSFLIQQIDPSLNMEINTAHCADTHHHPLLC